MGKLEDRIKIRVATRAPGQNWLPDDARALVLHYYRLYEENGLNPPMKVSLPDTLPKSLNHNYVGYGARRTLVPEVRAMRDQMAMRMDTHKRAWRSGGAMAAVIVIYSPLWITKEYCIRDMDIDNKIKPVLDAYVAATQVSDKGVWSVSAFKAVADRTLTRLWLFDCGGVVPRFELGPR